MKILIVEDNQPMRRIIRRVVTDVADEIIECGDGAQAFALYAEQLPDWVLMDVEMKGVDGITATRQIIAAYPQARIMIITDYNDDALRRAAYEAGACQYVVKENCLIFWIFCPKHQRQPIE